MHNSSELKACAFEQRFEIAGVCDAVPPPHFSAYVEWVSKGLHAGMTWLQTSQTLRADPNSLLEGVRSILAVGLNYRQPSAGRKTTGRVAMYAWGRDYHKVMRKKLRRIARWAEDRYPGLKCRICVDSAPILDRDYAFLAGLGWFGKNTCLIDTKRGSLFFIGLLLLNQRFEPDLPAIGGCGKCTLCIDACPTGALVIEPGLPVARLDSSRCISYLTIEHRGGFSSEQEQMLNGWLFGCDICQEVCPFNQPSRNQTLRSSVTNEPDFDDRNADIDLHWLAGATDAQIRERFAGTALLRAKPEGLRRNARALLKRRS
jgi:epoxyqueuosine reductase